MISRYGLMLSLYNMMLFPLQSDDFSVQRDDFSLQFDAFSIQSRRYGDFSLQFDAFSDPNDHFSALELFGIKCHHLRERCAFTQKTGVFFRPDVGQKTSRRVCSLTSVSPGENFGIRCSMEDLSIPAG